MYKHVYDDMEGCELERELLQAVPKGDVKRVRKLVGQIDNVQIHALESGSLCPPDFDACTPLSLAIAYGHFEIVKILIEAGSDKDWYLGFDDTVGDEDYGLYTPLFDALHMRRHGPGSKSEGLKILLYLFDVGADATNLHWQAIWFHDLEVFKFLMKMNGSDSNILFDSGKKTVDERDEDSGDTLLMRSADYGSVEIAKYLVSEGASTKLRNKKDQSAYIVAHEKLKETLERNLEKGYNDITEEEVKEFMDDSLKYCSNLKNLIGYMNNLIDVIEFLEDVTPIQHQG